MKRLLTILVVIFAAFAMIGCASTGNANEPAGAKYVLSEEDDVIAIYNFEEPVDEGDVPDASGNDNLGYTGGDGTYVEGKYGQAMVFNGSDGYIMIDEDAIDYDELTVAAWVKPDSWKDWARIFDFGDGGTTDAWLGFGADVRQLRFDVFSGPKTVTLLAPVPVPGKWTHVAATWGNGKASLYVNGRLVQQLPLSLKASELIRKGVFIGRSNWAADPLFVGAMDDVFVAGKVFDRKEIKALMSGIEIPEDAEEAAPAEVAK